MGTLYTPQVERTQPKYQGGHHQPPKSFMQIKRKAIYYHHEPSTAHEVHF